MRLPDDQKRQQILAAGAKLFAAERFDRVRLDDIAAAAGVGKGTLYIYFGGKDDLYTAIIFEGFTGLLNHLREQLQDISISARSRLRIIVSALVEFAVAHPQVYELMRTAGTPHEETHWIDKRRELMELIERTILDGIERGELHDAHPKLTALFIPGCVRTVMLFGPKDMSKDSVIDHIVSTVCDGIVPRDRSVR